MSAVFVLMLMLLGFLVLELTLLGFIRQALLAPALLAPKRVRRYKVLGAPSLARFAEKRPPVDVTAKTAWSNGTLRAIRQLDLERNTADAIVLAMTSSVQLCLSQTAGDWYPGFGANCD
jgi:hypothetical protein